MEAINNKIIQYFEQLKIPLVNDQIAPQNRKLLIQSVMEQLKILHIYGQIMPLEWQDSNEGVDYKPQQINEELLQKAANNIKTIYEQEDSPEIREARKLLSQAEQIFFLGFGYAPENMNLLQLPRKVPRECSLHGTAYGLEENEIDEIRHRIISGLLEGFTERNIKRVIIEDVDCLKLLKKYL